MPDSNYRQATEQMLLDEAQCEQCEATNSPIINLIRREGNPPMLQCRVCGHLQDWPTITIH